jgi:hypothetical protein
MAVLLMAAVLLQKLSRVAASACRTSRQVGMMQLQLAGTTESNTIPAKTHIIAALAALAAVQDVAQVHEYCCGKRQLS